MWKAVILALIAMLLMACGASPAAMQGANESDMPTVTVYKPPT